MAYIDCSDCQAIKAEMDKVDQKPVESGARKKGLVFAALAGGFAFGISALCVPFVLPGFRKICLPFVPATNQQLSNVMRGLRGRKGTLVDIGSGDGRIDLWKADLGKFNNVVIFGVDGMMPKLEDKLCTELKPGSRVVACRFPFPTWPANEEIGNGVDQVWVYDVNKKHSQAK